MSVRACVGWLASGLLLAAAGCSPPDADFVLSERTRELHRDAQQAVAAAVESNFGTPHDLIAWLRLPVNYGGVVYQQCGATWYVPQAGQYMVVAPPY